MCKNKGRADEEKLHQLELNTVDYPRMVDIVQETETSPVADPIAEIERGLQREPLSGIFAPGSNVAIAVGSRKIPGIGKLVSFLTEKVKASGGSPSIVPAMGSHGGATAEGQARVLESLGITGRAVGAPVVSNPDIVCLGETKGGATVYIDRFALEADALVLINRVAPHTGYSGPVQSGLQKMIAAGLGKWEGARSLHSHGFESGHLIAEMADLALSKLPRVAGIALVEDGRKEISEIEVLDGGEIKDREPELLAVAIDRLPRIPVDNVDILIVDEIGKDISGAGMDPMVTGRGKIFGEGEAPRFSTRRIVVLGLTEGSLGNANGIGHADITTEKLFRSTDWEVTYRNAITSGQLYRVKIPVIAQNARLALALALESLGGMDPLMSRIVRIRNTRELSSMRVSTAVERELGSNPKISVLPGGREWSFDKNGELL